MNQNAGLRHGLFLAHITHRAGLETGAPVRPQFIAPIRSRVLEVLPTLPINRPWPGLPPDSIT